MVTLFSILLFGFLLGMRHATDPDHVIAISTIIDREPTVKKAAWVGIFWGIGHTLTILAFGGVVILFTLTIPPELSMSLELVVAFMLIYLGLVNLKGFKQWIRNKLNSEATDDGSEHSHSHVHSHGDYIHSHPHQHSSGNLDHHSGDHTHSHTHEYLPTTWLDNTFGNFKMYQFIRPVIIGVIHGFAGTAALTIMIIPIIESSWVALFYLLIFGVGTITGMMLITAAIAFPFIYAPEKWAIFSRTNLRMVAGFFSLGFGLYMIYEIGFAGELFF